MTLSGLWHGASANFVLWGAYHGFLLIAYRIWKSYRAEKYLLGNKRLFDFLSRLTTFFFMVYGWLFFRVTEWGKVKSYTVSLFTDVSFASLGVLALASMGIFIAGAIAIDILESRLIDKITDNVRNSYWLAPYLTAMTMSLLILGSRSGGDFIYFKF